METSLFYAITVHATILRAVYFWHELGYPGLRPEELALGGLGGGEGEDHQELTFWGDRTSAGDVRTSGEISPQEGHFKPVPQFLIAATVAVLADIPPDIRDSIQQLVELGYLKSTGTICCRQPSVLKWQMSDGRALALYGAGFSHNWDGVEFELWSGGKAIFGLPWTEPFEPDQPDLFESYTVSLTASGKEFAKNFVSDLARCLAYPIGGGAAPSTAGKRSDQGGGRQLERSGEYVFRICGEFWEIKFQGEHGHFPDLKGFQIIRRLLSQPGLPISVLDLHQSNHPSQPRSTLRQDIMDPEAMKKLNERVTELNGEIEAAEKAEDATMASFHAAEKDKILAQIKSALGHRSKIKTFHAPDPRKSAQTSVCQRIKDALGKLRDEMPKLHQHFDKAINTGNTCHYVPQEGIVWELR